MDGAGKVGLGGREGEQRFDAGSWRGLLPGSRRRQQLCLGLAGTERGRDRRSERADAPQKAPSRDAFIRHGILPDRRAITLVLWGSSDAAEVGQLGRSAAISASPCPRPRVAKPRDPCGIAVTVDDLVEPDELDKRWSRVHLQRNHGGLDGRREA
jgi:hypothetical protein